MEGFPGLSWSETGLARIRVIIDKPASAVSCVMPTAVTRLYIATRCRPMLDHCLVIRYRANAVKQDGLLSIASSNPVADSILSCGHVRSNAERPNTKIYPVVVCDDNDHDGCRDLRT